ncbi:hypothetical protein [Phocoenobacter skyensis]|uniref:Integrase catalytic domain-containing protein n=1 Tax=Phocoenobacter skyensis TaxID=97481 RepID=A0A1H7V981_9PAST|nr:hypothetical protein [Pasteurella skyensis]QLB23353.1 hypothetical protein A6B44_09105 [Pasteurella skyensis]SEM05762.1 hypothetical protein SAMN05444853_10423 [Pasteurella skyensis]
MAYTTEIEELPDNRGWVGRIKNEKNREIYKTSNFCAKELAITALNKFIRYHNDTFGKNIPEVPQISMFG